MQRDEAAMIRNGNTILNQKPLKMRREVWYWMSLVENQKVK
jgi:hypothetical protein